MFKVVWKSFKYNRKNFLSFFMSEILSVAVIFMLIYIQEALSQVPGIKTEALQFAYQSELRKQHNHSMYYFNYDSGNGIFC